MILSFVCGSKQDVNKQDVDPAPDNRKVSAGDLKPNQAVIPAIEKMEWAFGRNYKQYGPTADDIETAETLLKECFVKEMTGTVNHFFGRKLDDYNRQFVGAEMEGGDKVIWINCFCAVESEILKKWKTEMIMVADGGNCFFNLRVNLNRKSYYDLMIN